MLRYKIKRKKRRNVSFRISKGNAFSFDEKAWVPTTSREGKEKGRGLQDIENFTGGSEGKRREQRNV